MCDEHTASKMSSFSTAKCNGLSGANIICMAQLQQYWANGIGSTTSKYAHLTLPKSQSQATSITLPAPTLQDLLNPELANNNSIVDTDPCRAAFLEGHECEDKDDTLVITRSGALKHLEINLITNLAKPKLTACFDECLPALLTTKALATQVL
jgi:hypothetical protein